MKILDIIYKVLVSIASLIIIIIFVYFLYIRQNALNTLSKINTPSISSTVPLISTQLTNTQVTKKYNIGDKIKIRDSEVTVTNVEGIISDNGTEAIKVTYTYKNIGTVDSNPMSVRITAFQKGVQCGPAFSSQEREHNETKTIKPGSEINNCVTYINAVRANGKITLQLSSLIGEDKSEIDLEY